VKIYFFFFVLLFSLTALSSVFKMDILFTGTKIKEGTIIPVKLKFNLPTSQSIPLNILVGQTLGSSFYIHQASPLVAKNNWTVLESEAQIVLAKIPKARPFIHKVGNKDLIVDWNDVQFLSTEAPKEMIYGDFQIPSRAQILKWLIILFICALLCFFGWKLQKRVSSKKHLKKRRALLRDEIISVKEYREVVQIWQKKSLILQEFPKLEASFKELEKVLFRYQFKPTQSDAEKNEVMIAFNIFISMSQEGFDGI
jgi:hypothetical protein